MLHRFNNEIRKIPRHTLTGYYSVLQNMKTYTYYIIFYGTGKKSQKMKL